MLENPSPGAFAHHGSIVEKPPALASVADEAFQALLGRRGHGGFRESSTGPEVCSPRWLLQSLPVTSPAVVARGLEYSYRTRRALAGVDFTVAAGEIFGFLGPNGGGKTTLFRILATLLPAQRGTVEVDGLDLAADAAAVRRRLGVVFQSPALDLQLTVRENLLHQGHLYGLAGADLAARIARGLDRFGLAGRARDRAGTLSGGLRRRVELAKALLHQPRILLLDEPSTGLDPGARRDLWDELAALAGAGVTVLLTTHFIEEADRCHRLALLDGGRIVAGGTPAALKEEIGGEVVTAATADPEGLAAALAEAFGDELTPAVHGGTVRFEVPRAHQFVGRLTVALPDWVERIDALTVARPSLEDVFLRRTGHGLHGDRDRGALTEILAGSPATDRSPPGDA
jgi:ABC-2 type transport system ATP-binding protein